MNGVIETTDAPLGLDKSQEETLWVWTGHDGGALGFKSDGPRPGTHACLSAKEITLYARQFFGRLSVTTGSPIEDGWPEERTIAEAFQGATERRSVVLVVDSEGRELRRYTR